MHWSNEHTIKEYFTEIILNGKRRALKLGSEQPALFLLNLAQCTSLFLANFA